MENLVPIVMFLSTALAIVGVTRIISEGRTRRRLIEAQATPELAQTLLAPPRQDAGLYDSLRWGLVIGAVGLALILIQFLPYGPEEPIAFGLVLLFGAGGLLAYYAAARRLTSK